MIGKRLISLWNQLSLKKKLYTIMMSMGAMLLIAILVNARVIYGFIGDVKILMDDNLSSYKFQEALGNEVDIFGRLIRNYTSDNETLLKASYEETEKILKALPYDYSQTGEQRYAITWNIRNSYAEYEKQRDKVMAMIPGESGYIDEVYKTYRMQEYLQDYAARLMKEVLDGGNNYYEERVSFLKRLPYVVCISSLLALTLFFYLTRMLTKNMITVLSDLVAASKGIEKNDFSMPDVLWEGQDEVGQLVYAFNKMKHSTQDYVHTLEEKREVEEKLYQQELEQAKLEQRFSEAQLQLIKSQLNPHFLFNTLNMIYRMAQIEEAPISQEMLRVLSNLLRYSLRTTAPFAPLDQELKIVEDYMYIQEKRFGERISWKIECEVQSQSIELPVFLLQPLVENAVIHGISMKEEGGSIEIGIKQDKEELCIVVKDSGLGMKKEKLEQIRNAVKQRGSGVGIGLGNIYRRILAYYEQGEVWVDSQENEGTCIQIILGRRKQ
jgi:sensor histidine kinase YesM